MEPNLSSLSSSDETSEDKSSTQDSNTGGLPPVPEKSKKKLNVVLIIVLLIILGVGIFLYLMSNNESDKNSDQQTTGTPSEVDSTMLYATKTGKQAKIYTYNLTKKTTKEEFNFEESYELDTSSGNYWTAMGPAADATSDGKEVVYTDKSNLILHTMGKTNEDILIKSKLEEGSSAGTYIASTEPALPTLSGPGNMIITAPVFSRDGKYVGVSVGHQEGGSLVVFDRTTKSFLNLGNTFRYIDMEGIPAKFTLLSETKQLATLGIHAGYLVKESGYLTNPTISLDGKSVLAILCPENLPTTGNEQYSTVGMAAKELAESKSRRDCGEQGERTVITISLSDGTYKTIGSGNFGGGLALSNDRLYVGGTSTAAHKVTKISMVDQTPSESIDLASLVSLETGQTISNVVLKNLGSVPYAQVYMTKADKNSVAVINLESKKVITTIELESKTAFKVLSVRE